VLEASVFSLLGKVVSVLRNREQGNSYFEKADNIYVNAGLENSYDYIKMLTGYGRALIYVWDYEKAIETLQKSNRLHRQKCADPTLIVAENYKFMAWAYREMGNFKKANSYFLQSIDLTSELTGDHTVQTTISMYHLARNFTLSGNYKKSEKLAKEVLSIYQKNPESDNQYILQAKNYVAIAKYNQNEYVEAEKIFKSIIKESNYPKYVTAVNAHLAVVYQNTGRFQEAVSLLKETITFNKKSRELIAGMWPLIWLNWRQFIAKLEITTKPSNIFSKPNQY